MKMVGKLMAREDKLSHTGQDDERRTGRSAPHPSAEEHHEETVTADTIVDFIDYSSVESGFH